MDDKPEQRADEPAEVDPGNPPGTDSSIQVGPDPTDPRRERGRSTEGEDADAG